MAYLRDEGLVLRTRNLGEADKVVTLLTRRRGKIQAAARGARRARSSLLPVSQLFAYGQYLVFINRSLHNLSQGQLVHPFRRLREDLNTMAYATYVAELADVSLPEEEPYDDAFATTLAAFELLEKGKHRHQLILYWYQLKMLVILGYQPEMTVCINCRQPLPTNSVRTGPTLYFDVSEGGCLCPSCASHYATARPLGLAVYKSMHYLLSTSAWQLADLRMNSTDEACIEDLLTSYIEHRLERHIYSGDFLRSLRNMQE